MPQTRRICPEKDIEKNNHFETIFVSDAEEKSVENNKGNGNNFIAYSVAPETEEEENWEKTEDYTCSAFSKTIAID